MVNFFFRNDLLDGRRLSYELEGSEDPATPEIHWRKVLYERQELPDNYTSQSVLRLLASREDSEPSVSYIDAVVKTNCVTQHISALAIFLLIWHAIRWEHIQVSHVLVIDLFLLILGYKARNLMVIWMLDEEAAAPCSPRQIFPRKNINRYVKDAVTAVYAFGTLLIMSPVLRTLTMSWSEDTIYAMTVMLLLMHLITHDYEYIYRQRDPGQKLHDNLNDLSRIWRQVDNTLALNAAMFAAVILASRLKQVMDVFAFICLAITVFMMLPTAQKCVYVINQGVYNKFLTVGMILGTLLVVFNYAGVFLGMLYISLIAFVSLLCPWLFMKFHTLRTELKGAWDIAHIQASDRAKLFTPMMQRRTSGQSVRSD